MLSTLRRVQGQQWRPWVRLCSSQLIQKRVQDGFIDKLRNSFLEDERSNLVVPTFKKALLYPDRMAVKDCFGEFTYFQLYITAKRLAIQISNICGSASLSHVAFLSSNNALWIAIQWSCWISGQVAVPLEINQPPEQLRRLARDCKPKLYIASLDCEAMIQDLVQMRDAATIVLDHDFIPTVEDIAANSLYTKQLVGRQGTLLTESVLPNDFYATAPAMLIYSQQASGTNNKSVLLSHRNIEAQVRCLVDSWSLSANDCMLHFISMNRMHAAMGGLLSVGGNLLMQTKFDGHNAWSALLGINSPSKQRVTLFLAMPGIYKCLIAEYDKMFKQDSRMVEYITNHCKQKVRLMATAFALLPEAVFKRWLEITGKKIYEYYGMLETGLVLGHPFDDQAMPCEMEDYRPGTLGAPLKGVTARLMSKSGKELIKWSNGADGDEKEESNAESPMIPMAIGELQIAGKDLYTTQIVINAMEMVADLPGDTANTALGMGNMKLDERKTVNALESTAKTTLDGVSALKSTANTASADTKAGALSTENTSLVGNKAAIGSDGKPNTALGTETNEATPSVGTSNTSLADNKAAMASEVTPATASGTETITSAATSLDSTATTASSTANTSLADNKAAEGTPATAFGTETITLAATSSGGTATTASSTGNTPLADNKAAMASDGTPATASASETIVIAATSSNSTATTASSTANTSLADNKAAEGTPATAFGTEIITSTATSSDGTANTSLADNNAAMASEGTSAIANSGTSTASSAKDPNSACLNAATSSDSVTATALGTKSATDAISPIPTGLIIPPLTPTTTDVITAATTGVLATDNLTDTTAGLIIPSTIPDDTKVIPKRHVVPPPSATAAVVSHARLAPTAPPAPSPHVQDGFFKTGDICSHHNGNFYFLSKSSDVFTVGGYEIYGSEIKRVLSSYPGINDVAVLGIPSKYWGLRLGVICIVSSETDVDLEAIKSHCQRHLPPHKCPTVFKTLISK